MMKISLVALFFLVVLGSLSAVAAKDLYETLGVGSDATGDEINKAWRRLAMKYHPDRNIGDAKAESLFKEVTAAYEILGDATKRRTYDSTQGFSGPRGGAEYTTFYRKVSDPKQLSTLLLQTLRRDFKPRVIARRETWDAQNYSTGDYDKLERYAQSLAAGPQTSTFGRVLRIANGWRPETAAGSKKFAAPATHENANRLFLALVTKDFFLSNPNAEEAATFFEFLIHYGSFGRDKLTQWVEQYLAKLEDRIDYYQILALTFSHVYAGLDVEARTRKLVEHLSHAQLLDFDLPSPIQTEAEATPAKGKKKKTPVADGPKTSLARTGGDPSSIREYLTVLRDLYLKTDGVIASPKTYSDLAEDQARLLLSLMERAPGALALKCFEIFLEKYEEVSKVGSGENFIVEMEGTVFDMVEGDLNLQSNVEAMPSVEAALSREELRRQLCDHLIAAGSRMAPKDATPAEPGARDTFQDLFEELFGNLFGGPKGGPKGKR